MLADGAQLQLRAIKSVGGRLQLQPREPQFTRPMAALQAALAELTAQCTGPNVVPTEVFNKFPQWDSGQHAMNETPRRALLTLLSPLFSLSSELPTTTALGAARLRSAIAVLEEAELNAKQENRKADVTSYSYVRGVLVAAINLHEFYSSRAARRRACIWPPRPPRSPSARAATSSTASSSAFRPRCRLRSRRPSPTFAPSLNRRASGHPPSYGGGGASSSALDAAYADVACRLNTEASTGFAFPPLGGQSPLHLEAQALAFCVHAFSALVQSKSAVAVADAVAAATSSTRVASTPPDSNNAAWLASCSCATATASEVTERLRRPVTSTRDAHLHSRFRGRVAAGAPSASATSRHRLSPTRSTRAASGAARVASSMPRLLVPKCLGALPLRSRLLYLPLRLSVLPILPQRTRS